MKRTLQLLVVGAALSAPVVLAQESTQEFLREMEINNRAAQIEMEQSRLRWEQMEAESTRRNAELEQLRLETDRLRLWNESQDATNQAREFAEHAEQAAQQQAEAAKQAEEAADELREEIEQSGVRSRNYIYLAVFTMSVGGLVWHIIRRSRNEEPMKENQKLGIAVIVVSLLAMVLSVMISDGWAYKFDFLQNLMTTLRIKLFVEDDCTEAAWHQCSYLVDFPTKYATIAWLCSAAYGFTTYLGITPSPKVVRKYFETESRT